MANAHFEEITCKTALNRVDAPGLPFRWSLNPYRGCQHACIYCYARAYHDRLGLGAGRDFEHRIIIKTNLPEVLRRELSRPGWRRETVAIGTACDAYQPAERVYGITRAALKAFVDYASPASIVTKSPGVTRDIDVLQQLGEVASVTVAFSVSTLDEAVWRRIEPQTAMPSKRLEAMRELANAGVRTGVLLAPILPGLTDDPADLEAVVRAAAGSGASFVAENVLHLRPGTKEWFMPALREMYPYLAERYARLYRGPYAPHRYTAEVQAVVWRLRERFGLTPREVAPMPPRGQLQLAM